MTAITQNTTYNGSNSYYSLNQSNTVAASGASATANAASIPTLSSTGAYMLDLSPEAQQYLSQSSNILSNQSFVLSSAQRKTLEGVLEKYRNVPLTQDNYNKLQDDLRDAGLSSEQLALQERVRSFNPTGIFINILSGKTDNLTDIQNAQSQTTQTKSAQYMSEIVNAWKSIAGKAEERVVEAVEA